MPPRLLAAALLALTAALTPAPLAATAAPAAAAPPAAAAAKPAPAAVIAGKVSGADGKPVAGATVRAIPVPPKASGGMFRGGAAPDAPKAVVTKTDAAGAFKLEGLTGGPFALRAEAPGLAPALAPSVPVGATLDLRLKPGFPVVGRVLDLTTQKPVAGAVVTAIERDAARFGKAAAHTVSTADNGTFTIPECAPGVVTLSAIAPGKARAELDGIPVKAPVAGEEPRFDAHTMFLQPGGRLAGRVTSADGKPIADAIVTATPSDGNIMAMFREGGRSSVRSEANGAFAFDGVPAGNKYLVRASKPGYAADEEGPIPIDGRVDRTDVELKLDTGASLAFRLVTAGDVPVNDVDVKLATQGGPRRRGPGLGSSDVDREKIVSQGDGKFLVKALEPGTFDVTLAPPDYADVAKPAQKLKSGETLDLGTLRVKESKSISGRVVDGTGQPVAGASISALWFEGMSGRSRETKSGADGKYRLSGLGDEPVRNLWARAEGFAQGEREGAMPGDTGVDFTMQRTGSVVGRVVLPNGGAPAAFRVQASPEAKEGQERGGFRMVVRVGGAGEKFFTDPTGHFRLDDVEPGTVTITVLSDGKAPARKTGIAVAPDQVQDIGTLTLEDGKTLRGRVVASKDDAPIPGASVSLTQPQGMGRMMGNDLPAGMAVSALDGRFEVSGLEARTYAIDANQPDYSPNSGRVEIPADGDPDEFVIHLSKGGTLTGLVRDAAKQPVTGAQVMLLSPGRGMEPQMASAGTDGRYSFEKLTPGDYTVMRAPTGGGAMMIMGGMKQANVREGEVTVFDLDESSKINLSGRVLKGGQPVANASLFFSLDGGDHGSSQDLRQSRTDTDGRYQIGLDQAGTYSVMVSTGRMFGGGGRNAVSVAVPDQPSPVVDIPLRFASITGHVVNDDGKPVSGAVVSVSASPRENENQRAGEGITEPDGAYEIGGVAPGTYKVVAAASGYRSAEVSGVSITNESDAPAVDITLTPGRSARGRVIDASGNGIAGAMVMAASAGTMPSSREALPATTDINGGFVLTVPADGAIDVTAVAAGFPAARLSGVVPQDGTDLLVRAPRASRVRVTVLASDGKPAMGARVSARAVPSFLGSDYLGFLNAPVASGTDGVAVVGSLAAGAYELVVSSGPKRATRTVTIGEGTEGVEVVTLP